MSEVKHCKKKEKKKNRRRRNCVIIDDSDREKEKIGCVSNIRMSDKKNFPFLFFFYSVLFLSNRLTYTRRMRNLENRLTQVRNEMLSLHAHSIYKCQIYVNYIHIFIF